MKIRGVRNAEIIEGTVSIFVNVILWALRLFAGYISGSLALISDAWHGLSDVFTSLAVISSSKMASKPPDEHHPYGHGKIAEVTSFLMGLALIGVAIFFIYEGIRRVSLGKDYLNYEMMHYAIISAALVVPAKEALARWAIKLGRKYKSNLCIADGLHHRADAVVTISVVVGLIFVWILKSPHLDTAFTIGVALLIIHEGLKVAKSSFMNLIDSTPPELKKKIKEIAMSINGVMEAHDIRVRNYGGLLFVDLCIHLREDMSVKEAHEIAHKIEEKIKKELKNVMEVFVHQEPQ